MQTLFQGTDICSISGETISEEKANFLTHSIGLILSIAGFIFLVISAYFSQDKWIALSSIIYGITLILMYCSSTLYHSCKIVEKKKRLRILDHACIYLLIAGSYTPILFGTLGKLNAWSFCAAVWSIAFIGIILKVFFTGRFVLLSTALYLLMGWGCVLILDSLLESLSKEGFMWLAAGGLFYSFGVIFFLWEKLPYNHSIWHLFVLGGSGCHYYLITFYIALS